MNEIKVAKAYQKKKHLRNRKSCCFSAGVDAVERIRKEMQDATED